MSLTINHNLMAMNSARNLDNHYGALSVSTRRLSSGLRIGTSADDAAGLAIRELMRSEVKSLHQGIRNANDAISMVQTADGALQVIDEKLIRMKELAMQASTGTYNSDQRLIIDSEFQAMKSEIERIAQSAEFNGIKLLEGGVSSSDSTPEYLSDMFMHFRFNNSYAGEYGNNTTPQNATAFSASGPDGGESLRLVGQSGDVDMPAVPPGGHVELPQVDWATWGSEATLSIWVNEQDIIDNPEQESYVTFNGGHVSIHRNGTNIIYTMGSNSISMAFDMSDRSQWVQHTMTLDATNFNVYQDGVLVGQQASAGAIGAPPAGRDTENAIGRHYWTHGGNRRSSARFVGNVDDFRLYTKALSDYDVAEMNQFANAGTNYYQTASQDVTVHFGTGNDSAEDFYDVSIGSATTNALGIASTQVDTQSRAQNALGDLDDAIIYKDKVRAHLGAMQNRLENTVANLEAQAENLQASESRISDVDVAQEMTEFVRNQILTQAAVAMLAQANSLPRMAMQLIGG
jgi:flagellin